jgi:hypothetical protein
MAPAKAGKSVKSMRGGLRKPSPIAFCDACHSKTGPLTGGVDLSKDFRIPVGSVPVAGTHALGMSRRELSSWRAKTNQIAAIPAKSVPVGSLQAGAMAGETDKSRRYLRWAAANEGRAASTNDEELKTLFLRIAAQYRDLAEQIDDPEQWRAKRRGRQR